MERKFEDRVAQALAFAMGGAMIGGMVNWHTSIVLSIICGIFGFYYEVK